MKIIRGREIADKILKELKEKISQQNLELGLAVVLVGQNEASELYVRLKKKAAEEAGIKFKLYNFTEKNSEPEIIELIKNLNTDKNITGIIVQLPLPEKFNTQKIISSIAPEKDADGFSGESQSLPVFPSAIMRLAESSEQEVSGKFGIVVANSKEFGETMVGMLEQKKNKSKYILVKDLENSLDLIKKADIIITAVGKPKLISGNMLKEGVIVIDGGISKINGKVVGDVDFESVKNIISAISPVPGGVGPVTIACLLENVYRLTKK